MTKPDDIPQDVWETAELEALKYVEWLTPTPADADAEHVLTISFARAILAERERCAKLCDKEVREAKAHRLHAQAQGASRCVSRIRSHS